MDCKEKLAQIVLLWHGMNLALNAADEREALRLYHEIDDIIRATNTNTPCG